jgi:hypothetical protein
MHGSPTKDIKSCLPELHMGDNMKYKAKKLVQLNSKQSKNICILDSLISRPYLIQNYSRMIMRLRRLTKATGIISIGRLRRAVTNSAKVARKERIKDLKSLTIRSPACYLNNPPSKGNYFQKKVHER